MKILYAKYNRHRLPAFQTATLIVEDNGRRWAVKRALTPAARAHLQTMWQEQAWLRQHLAAGRLILPEALKTEDDALTFPFIDGPSLDALLFQAFLDRDREQFLRLLDDYAAGVRAAFETTAQPGAVAALAPIFGRTDFGFRGEGERYFVHAPIDLIFDNLIIRESGYVLIDNEWVFPGSLPVSYAIYRALFEFCHLKCRAFGIETFLPFQELAQRYGMDARTVSIYREMEDRFQDYVCGPQRPHYYHPYLKAEETITHLQQMVRDQTAEISRQNDLIGRQQGELEQLRPLAKYLDDILHSTSWRMLQRVCVTVDRLLPPGSRRRRWARFFLRRLP